MPGFSEGIIEQPVVVRKCWPATAVDELKVGILDDLLGFY